jgi:hypothetical protein
VRACHALWDSHTVRSLGPVCKKFAKLFKILRHIESLDACIKH